jgi:hypothetical protein
VRMPIATWNPARGVWETLEMSVLCGHAVPYSVTLPTSGSMRNGCLYPPQMPGLRIAGTGSSSSAGLFKTPTVQIAVNGGSQHPDKRRAGGHGPTLADQVEKELLPTPGAADWKGSSQTQGRTRKTPAGEWARKLGDMDLPEAIALLPTPNTMDSLPARDADTVKARNRGNGDNGGSPRNLRETIANELTGDATPRRSRGGKLSSDGQFPGQLSLLDVTEA